MTSSTTPRPTLQSDTTTKEHSPMIDTPVDHTSLARLGR